MKSRTITHTKPLILVALAVGLGLAIASPVTAQSTTDHQEHNHQEHQGHQGHNMGAMEAPATNTRILPRAD